MFIVKYDWEDFDGTKTYGIEDKVETWQEAIDLRDSLKVSDGASRIEIIDEEY